MIAVSDTGPILYLSLINCTYLLPQIFEKVLIPRAVADKLSDTATPPKASALIEDLSPRGPVKPPSPVKMALKLSNSMTYQKN